MRPLKLIIFDLDGTLVDAYEAITKSFNYTMHALGYPCQKRLVIRRAVGWGDAGLLKPFVEEKDLKKALLVYRRHHAQALKTKAGSRLLPYASFLLARLKAQGYSLAIASNRPTRFSLLIIRYLKIRQYFAYVLCADTLTRGKPDPEILTTIMKKLSVAREETLYVGDMTIDAKTGNAAKVKTVIVTTGSSSKAEIKKELPYRIITSLKQLLAIV